MRRLRMKMLGYLMTAMMIVSVLPLNSVNAYAAEIEETAISEDAAAEEAAILFEEEETNLSEEGIIEEEELVSEDELPAVCETIATLEPIQNVKLDSWGVLTWDAFPGAQEYSVSIGTRSRIVTTTTQNLNDLALEWDYDSDTYNCSLSAYGKDENGRITTISELYLFSFRFVKRTTYSVAVDSGTASGWDGYGRHEGGKYQY